MGGSDDDGKGSNEEEDSEDDYDDVYDVAGREGDATTSEKMRRARKEPVGKRRADVEGGDGEEGGEDAEGGGGGGDDGSSDDDYDGEDGMTTPGGRGTRDSKSLGMADAMSRILGTSSSSSSRPPSSSSSAGKGGTTTTNASRSAASRPVILSKTTTPLQRLQQKLKMEERALRQKRRNRRAENLVAMRLPLAPTAGMSAERLWKQKTKAKKKKMTASTTATSGERKGDGENDDDDHDDPAGGDGGHDDDDENAVNAMAIANEIEAERAHRRIATRGVVALFNAISKHRSAVAAEAAEREEARRRVREEGRLRGLAARGGRRAEDGDGVGKNPRTTKHGFLDMIKMSAAGAEGTAGAGGGDDAGGRRERGSGGANDDASAPPGGGGRNNGGAKSTGWGALKDDFMMNSKLKVRDFSTCTTRLGSVVVERHFFLVCTTYGLPYRSSIRTGTRKYLMTTTTMTMRAATAGVRAERSRRGITSARRTENARGHRECFRLDASYIPQSSDHGSTLPYSLTVT